MSSNKEKKRYLTLFMCDELIQTTLHSLKQDLEKVRALHIDDQRLAFLTETVSFLRITVDKWLPLQISPYPGGSFELNEKNVFYNTVKQLDIFVWDIETRFMFMKDYLLQTEEQEVIDDAYECSVKAMWILEGYFKMKIYTEEQLRVLFNALSSHEKLVNESEIPEDPNASPKLKKKNSIMMKTKIISLKSKKHHTRLKGSIQLDLSDSFNND